MVIIVPASVVPYTNSIAPAIKLSVIETVQQNTLLLRIDGQVFAEDGKYLANLIELPLPPSNLTMRAKGLSDYQPYQMITYKSELMFTLDKKSLDYIENVRQKNKKHDVVFKFTIHITFLSHDIAVGDYSSRDTQMGKVILSSWQQPSRAETNLNMLVPTSTALQLFNYQISQLDNHPYTISSSDWVNDFQEYLGIGKFMIIEIPEPELVNVSDTQLTQEQKNFKERLDKAYTILPKMELELKRGEWGDVVKLSRELLELFKKDVTQFIKDTVSKTTGVDERTAGALTMAIDNLYSYANELHHEVDSKGNVKDVYTGGKEDAEMTYMLSSALVKLLAKKFKSVVTRSA